MSSLIGNGGWSNTYLGSPWSPPTIFPIFCRLGDYLFLMKDIEEILKELVELDEAMLLFDSEPDSEQYYIISGSGWGWFLDPETKELARVPRGTEIVPMPGEPDERGQPMPCVVLA